MHILVTADTVGGVWTYARELVTGLVRHDVQVTLVSFGEIPTASQTAWLERLPNVDFHPTGFRLEWMQDSSADLEASARYLSTLIDEVQPDLLHLNQFYYGALPNRVPRIVVGHSDVVSWWVSVHGYEPPQNSWMQWYREAVTRGLASATAIVAPSEWMLQQLQKHYGSFPDSSVIHNGRTPQVFNPHISKDAYAISIGRLWDFGKNVKLLEYLEPPLPVYIAGSARSPEADSSAVTGAHHPRVTFLQEQSEIQLQQLFARARIYIGTSQYEPFGLAPLEAALSRCALLLSDIPTFRELWGDAACYFRNNDAESLQQELDRLAGDSAMSAAYGRQAFDRASRLFSASKMVEQYLLLYQTLTQAEALAA